MKHDLVVEGYGYRLRPVTLADAAFIVELRTSDPDRCRFIHPIPPVIEKQEEWLHDYFLRDNDYYWVVERLDSGKSEGVVGIYDLDRDRKTAEWGRWVLRVGSLAAVESAWLVYKAAFELLGLDLVYCHTVANNMSVVSFHDHSGIRRIGNLPGFFNLNGIKVDAVRHDCHKSDWPRVDSGLGDQAKMFARRWAKRK